MDIHRCRFVPYPPSMINSVAFSHSHISKDQKTAAPRLAVGRANGDIEIWNPLKGSWLQETIIRGGKDRSVDGLVWTQDPNEEDANGRTIAGKSRLFSIGYTTTVTEWDLERGRPLRQTSGNHGEIWCLAAQPALKLEEKEKTTTQWIGQNLIAGCTDGALVLYSTEGEDLQLQRVLVRSSVKKAKMISIIFQNRNIVIAGCTDSTIRVYDIRNGLMLRSMSLGSGPAGGPKGIIVWSVKMLQNGVIVSGDSTGEVRIWDGKTYTLMQRIKGHRQDVLSLAASYDGSTIFSGGMDRRTVVYKQVGKGKPRFAEVAHRRYHTHDVKTMATLEGRGMSVVVSGGPDASPVVLPLGQFGMENQRTLPFLSQDPPLISSPSQRLLVSYWDRELNIWRLLKPSEPSADDEEGTNQAARNRKLVAKILVKGEESITSASLSPDGSVLAASTTADIKLFHLRPRSNVDGETLRISKLSIPTTLSTGARLLQFSPDGKWLCIIRCDNRLHLVRATWQSASTPSPPTFHAHLTKLERIDRKIEKHVLLGGLGAYDRTIKKVAFSSDSRILVVSDLAGYIDTFILSGHEDLTQPSPEDSSDAASSSDSSDSDDDSGDEDEKVQLVFGQHWTRNATAISLPKLPSTPVILSFRPTTKSSKAITNGISLHPTRHNPHPVSHFLPTSDTTEDRLLVLTATSEVFEFDVLKGSLSAWSRRNPTSRFPEEFRQVRDQPRGCIWDVKKSRERVWLYGIGWLWMFDLSRDLPQPTPAQDLAKGKSNGLASGVQPNPSSATLSKKRKRHGKEPTSGAGSSIPDHTLTTGISRTMQRTIHEEINEVLPLSAPQKDTDAMQLDDDDDDLDDDAIPPREIPSAEGEADEGVVENGIGGESSPGEDRPHYWHTFKYRPIMGIVEIGTSTDLGPEVAIVERPAWEAELPPRFYGDQEWVKGDVI